MPFPVVSRCCCGHSLSSTWSILSSLQLKKKHLSFFSIKRLGFGLFPSSTTGVHKIMIYNVHLYIFISVFWYYIFSRLFLLHFIVHNSADLPVLSSSYMRRGCLSSVIISLTRLQPPVTSSTSSSFSAGTAGLCFVNNAAVMILPDE